MCLRCFIVFRDVPLGYPTVLYESGGEREAEMPDDWLSAGKRRFVSGPLDFGPAMLITPTCAVSAQGAAGYAHPVRTLVVVGPLRFVIAHGFLTRTRPPTVARYDRFAN